MILFHEVEVAARRSWLLAPPTILVFIQEEATLQANEVSTSQT